MLATLCFTGAANSQTPDQPRREPERSPRENPEARRPNPDQPRPEIRSANPEPPRPEARREEGRKPATGALAPWQRRSEMRKDEPRNGDRSRTPEIRRPSVGDRQDASRRSPGSSPVPPGPRSGPDPLGELREQVQRLTRQVHELRAMLEAQRSGMQRLAERRRSGFQPPVHRSGPAPGSRDSQAPMPPRQDSRRADRRPHGDAGAQENARPHPPRDHPMPHGDRDTSGDRDRQGNPPPPR